MIDREVKKLRRELERQSRRRERRWYPRELRERAVLYARQARAEGKSDSEIAEELGVNRYTFARWEQRRGGSFRAVELVETGSEASDELRASSPIVITPSGIRVEGLTLDGLVELLRRVG
ncbi:MAG: helix-turn-helix domain-containing protein [Thermoanaerobaculia bacterium]